MSALNKRYQNAGFSLVELMISLTLGLLLIAAVGALFYSNKQNFNQNNLIGELQDNARFAMDALARDLQMAGFLGGMLDVTQLETDSDSLDVLTAAADCGPGADGAGGWAFDRNAIEFIDDATAAQAAAAYACLGGANAGVVPRTDVLSVRRVSGQATAQINALGDANNLTANAFYLRTNNTAGTLFFSGADAENASADAAPSQPPFSFWEYYSRIYFVRPYAEDPGDGVPTLVRAFLTQDPTPRVEIERLAEGVEDMQIAFGIDTTGDGIANQYLSNPSQAQITQAVTARMQLLVRSVQGDFSYQNDKTYNLFGKDDDGDGDVDETSVNPAEGDGYAPDDNFYRRIVQTTVILRNPSLQQGFTP